MDNDHVAISQGLDTFHHLILPSHILEASGAVTIPICLVRLQFADLVL